MITQGQHLSRPDTILPDCFIEQVQHGRLSTGCVLSRKDCAQLMSEARGGRIVITESEVRRIEASAMTKLRKVLGHENLKRYRN